jgi:predicted Zn-dependent protease with MMP-like domain
MTREEFRNAVADAIDSLPAEFRREIENVAVLVEDSPEEELPSKPGEPKRLLLGLFHGVPRTYPHRWSTALPPNRIVLYQKNIEAVCHTEEEIRHQVRQTVIHEFGHYFGMTEEQLRGV